MINLDARMQAVIDAALAATTSAPAWQRAIRRAGLEFGSNPYLDYRDGELLILSSSNNIYAANGSCQCKAYANKRPCWHRAASRLVRNYFAK